MLTHEQLQEIRQRAAKGLSFAHCQRDIPALLSHIDEITRERDVAQEALKAIKKWLLEDIASGEFTAEGEALAVMEIEVINEAIAAHELERSGEGGSEADGV